MIIHRLWITSLTVLIFSSLSLSVPMVMAEAMAATSASPTATTSAAVATANATAAAVATETLEIECGDVQAEYVGSDLSPQFLETYLSSEKIAGYKTQGMKYRYAGRNCGMGSYSSDIKYEVLLLTSSKRFLIRDYMDALGIVGAEIILSGDLDAVKEGVVLSGTGRHLSTPDGTTTGTISTSRAWSSTPVVVIIRSHPNLR